MVFGPNLLLLYYHFIRNAMFKNSLDEVLQQYLSILLSNFCNLHNRYCYTNLEAYLRIAGVSLLDSQLF